MKAHGDVVKLRSRIVLIEKSRTLAKCMTCGNEMEVPLQLKSLSADQEEASVDALPELYVAR